MATIIGEKQGITHIDLSIDNGTRNYQIEIAIGAFRHTIKRHLFMDRQGNKRIIIYSSAMIPLWNGANKTATAVSGIEISGPAVLLTADETEDELRGL